MVGKKIKSILDSRAFRIVFSVLAAIVLWVYVEHVLNEDIESQKIVVEVDFLNPERLTDRELVITEVRTQKITLTFTGKRNDIAKLYAEGAVRVTTNLSDVTAAGNHALTYTISYGDGINDNAIDVASRSDLSVSINVEKLFKREVPLVAYIEGENLAMEGYQAEPIIFSPETVTVSGPQSEVEKITALRVTIQRENLTKTVVADMEFVPVDEDGEEITSEQFDFDRDTVAVTIPISMVKELALEIVRGYGAGATAENTVVTISPQTITVSGAAEELSTINSITLTTIDLTLFESYHTVTVPIILPNEVTNLTGVTEAEVTISIKGLETKTLTVPSQNFQVTNVAEGYAASLITSNLEITVRGTETVLEQINVDNIRVVVDVLDVGAGAVTVPAKVRIDGVEGDCGAIGEYRVTLRLTKDEGG